MFLFVTRINLLDKIYFSITLNDTPPLGFFSCSISGLLVSLYSVIYLLVSLSIFGWSGVQLLQVLYYCIKAWGFNPGLDGGNGPGDPEFSHMKQTPTFLGTPAPAPAPAPTPDAAPATAPA